MTDATIRIEELVGQGEVTKRKGRGIGDISGSLDRQQNYLIVFSTLFGLAAGNDEPRCRLIFPEFFASFFFLVFAMPMIY